MANDEAIPQQHLFYPEMGGAADTRKLFYTGTYYKKQVIQWAAERDAEARALLKRERIRPSNVRQIEPKDCLSGKTVFGGTVIEAEITWEAYRKISDHSTSSIRWPRRRSQPGSRHAGRRRPPGRSWA